MSSPPPQPDPPRPAAPTSHRKTRSGPEVVRRLAPPLAAVTAVVVVILLLLVLNSRPSASGPAPGAVAEPPTSSTSVALSSPPIPSTATPSAPASASPVASVPVSEPPATQPPATQPTSDHPPVTVLNNSRRTGLAAHVAAEVRAKGWSVAKTGNFRGRIVETTLYYAPGQSAAAAELAHRMPQVRRIAPRFAGLPGRGLTLVVTRDWSG